jgi:hypothetical protein
MQEAVAIAARQLMSVNVWAGAAYVSFPIFYPSGTSCVVKVEPDGSGFLVSDYGATFREVDHLGLGSGFTKSAKKFADEIGASVRDQEIICHATIDTLAMTMACIAQASSDLAAKMESRAGSSAEQQIQVELISRLERVFGKDAVKPDDPLVGQSAKEWNVDAVVYSGGRQIAFDFVRNNAQSVYAVAAKFHDIRAVERPPLAVAVVESKEALGVYHSLLTQAGRVIEAGQSDETFVRAAA